ncbi:uncharacterized protein TNCV_1432771 [Trichonephila clavipes]|nr:uncharacterized protein TNCV_1432771 [Trichonephila clavipes]
MTDHNPLVWLNRNVSSNPRLMRWALALQPYNFRIVHRSDALWRLQLKFVREFLTTGSAYLDALQLWPQLKVSEPDNFIWQQDGAPPHWHLLMRDWLNITVLEQLICRLMIKEVSHGLHAHPI